MVITAEENLEGGAEYELQAKCYSRQLILHPKVVNSRKLSISVDYLPCFKDGMTGGGIIVASCDNLMLCSQSHDDDYDDGVYDLCNPYTKQWIQLPPAPSKGQAILGMICDPTLNDYDVPKGLGGVGLKPRHSDCASFMDQLAHQRFRVVRVPLPVIVGGASGFKVEMLSCDSGRWQWTELRVLPPLPLNWREPNMWVRKHAVACNGLLHWLLGSTEQLVVYDPYTNEVKVIIERPQEAVSMIYSLCLLGASSGSVWVAQYVSSYYSPYGWFIWQLSPDYDGWILRHRLKEVFLRGFFQMKFRSMAMLHLLAIHPNDSNIIYVLWSKHTRGQGFENVVGRFDLATMESKLVGSKTSHMYSWHQTCVLTPPPSFLLTK